MADRYDDRDRRWEERRYDDDRRPEDRGSTGLVDRARNWWDRNVGDRERDRPEWGRDRDWRTERSREDEQWHPGSREPWLERDRDRDRAPETYSGNYGRPTFGREGRGDYAESEGRRMYGGTGSYGGGMMSTSTSIGSYAGRGPKNWRRSDERILEDINEHLTRDPQVDATDIEVAVLNGEVTLGGFVNDRREKHLAEECVWRVLGVRDVNNQIRSKQGVISSAFRGDDQTR